LPPAPNWEDYWAHEVAEKAKAKVLAHFGILAVLVSLLITLYGVNGIKTLLEDKFVSLVEKKEKEASLRIEQRLRTFEKQKLEPFERALAELETDARARHKAFTEQVLAPQYRANASVAVAGQRVDLSADIGPIRDQGNEGLTVGFSIAYAMQAAIKQRDGKAAMLSARGIFNEARKYDEWPGEDYYGSSVEGGLKAMRATGAYLEADWPYAAAQPSKDARPAYKISHYHKLARVADIKARLIARQPVIAQLMITRDFDKPDARGHIVVKEPLKELGGHSVTIVGYDQNTAEFTLANMWGTGWGNKGFATIRDADLAKILTGAYVLEL
jgi:C1A family cysteine protease